MRYLTTYLNDELDFKFGNVGSKLELKAVDEHTVMSFSDEDKLVIRVKNGDSYIKTVPVTADGKIIQLYTNQLKDLSVGTYDIELWQGEGNDQIVYPDEGFLRLNIHGNALQTNGKLISSITLADFEKKFNDLAAKVEERIKNLPNIDGKVNADIKVENGHLLINGEDTGVDLTTHNGKDGKDGINGRDGVDGKDGHTPTIDVSSEGTLVVDGVDTHKNIVGPKGDTGKDGEQGIQGEQGKDGKSAYQVAVDNGFDGTEVEWLRSLHGNDGVNGHDGAKGETGERGPEGKEGPQGIPGKNGIDGRDGKSAYEIAVEAGFQGGKEEWLKSLKGEQGERGEQGIQGPKGDQGIAGIDGKDGRDGITPKFSIGEVTTLSPDEKASVTINTKEDNENEYVLNIGIPQGIQGVPGQTVVKDEDSKVVSPTIVIGNVSAGQNANATLVPNGDNNYVLNLTLPKGMDGVEGKAGVDGKSAYQIAIDNGFIGEEKAWLDSLKGKDGKNGSQGPQGAPGENGKDGINGKSAYEIAIQNGFSGTEKEWLDSLKGPQGLPGQKGEIGPSGKDGHDGKNGVDGKSAYQLWLDLGHTGTEQDFVNSLKGSNGSQGVKGDRGPEGPAGKDGTNGTNGQSAYQIAQANGFTGTEQEWLSSLKGKDGAQGIQGPQGKVGPQGPIGAKGDTGAQGIQGPKGDKGLQGPKGETGKTGAQGPKGDNGLSAYQIAKNNGFSGDEKAWLNSLKGTKGETGPQGAKGDKGDVGPRGPQGLQGPAGSIPDVSGINNGIKDNTEAIAKINSSLGSWPTNIIDFGARAEDPSYDSAGAINKAIQALGTTGGTIYIPNGNFFVKSPITVDRSYVHIMGYNNGLRSGIDPADGKTQTGGGGAKITVPNAITAFKLENTHNSNRLSGITFSGFDLKGDTNAGVGIDGISNTDRTVIDNMTINNVGIGVRLFAADAPRITNSWIAETQSSILLTGASQQAEIKNNSLGAQPKGTTVYLENPDRYNITGNNIYPDGAAAIRILNPVHGVIGTNTISSYYNGMVEFLPNSDGTVGNGNVIANNVLALEAWHDNPDKKDNKWGIVHIKGFSNVIAGNNILANGSPTNTTGILIMQGDYNRIANNVISMSDTDSKVVCDGSTNNNWVVYSTEGSSFQDGGNSSNRNIGI